MTDTREALALLLDEQNVHTENGLDYTSQTIIDMIIARIPPLVWNEYLIASPAPYQIWPDNGGSGAPDDPYEKYNNFRVFEPVSMFSIGPKGDGSDEFDSLEAAKAAANAHHVAQLCKGMGIE